jgi:hypothetical protein
MLNSFVFDLSAMHGTPLVDSYSPIPINIYADEWAASRGAS